MAKHLEYAQSDEEGAAKTQPKTFEDILEQIGGFGRFQFMILLFVLFYEIPSGFLAFVPVFVGANPGVWKCETAGDDSSDSTVVPIMSSSSDEICECQANGSTLSAPPFTIVSEWNLICDSSWAVTFITNIQMFGMLFGNLIPPLISDWYGRKISFLILMILMAGGQCGSALAPNPYLYAVGRFFCGVGLAGYFSLNGIYSMEFLTPKWRQLGGCLGPLGEGLMLLGILAYYIKPWRLLLWATAFPFITVIFVFPFLPESPRWLLRQKRIEEAEGVLRYIARVNGTKFKGQVILREISEQEGQGEAGARYSYMDLFRRKEVRGKTYIFIGIWFCWAFTYFGLSYNIRNFGIDPYIMTILMGTVDAIGFRAALLVNNRLGRRKALVVFTGISAVFFLSVAFIQLFNEELALKYQTIFITFILLGKMCVAGARSAIRVLTVESYPVAIRTMGFGVSRVSASVGGFAAPQIALVGSIWPSVPLFAFGLLGFLGSLLSLLLRETGGQILQDGMQGPGARGKIVPSDNQVPKVLEGVDINKNTIKVQKIPPFEHINNKKAKQYIKKTKKVIKKKDKMTTTVQRPRATSF